MDEYHLVRPHIVPDAGLASAGEAQRLDPGPAHMAELESAILWGEYDRRQGFDVDAAQEIRDDGLDELPLDAAFAAVPSAQSLENPHPVLR